MSPLFNQQFYWIAHNLTLALVIRPQFKLINQDVDINNARMTSFFQIAIIAKSFRFLHPLLHSFLWITRVISTFKLFLKLTTTKDSDLKVFVPKEHTTELHLHTTEQKSTQSNQNTLPSTVHTTECTKQSTASRTHDLRTWPNLKSHKTHRHSALYLSLWIMSHRKNQLEWCNRPDTDRLRLICRPPFSMEMQHTTEPRCSVVCVHDAGLCASRLGCVEGHPCYCEWQLNVSPFYNIKK